jgi:hypothetical protein
VNFDAHYTPPYSKQQAFGISVGAWFENPYSSGARQAWLLTITPNPAYSIDSAAAPLVDFEMYADEAVLTEEAAVEPDATEAVAAPVAVVEVIVAPVVEVVVAPPVVEAPPEAVVEEAAPAVENE